VFLNPVLGLLLCIPGARDTARIPSTFDERFPLELTGEVTDDADGSALIEALDWIRLHPYDLNTITPDELLRIPCVTLSGVRAIIAFREAGGYFHSKGELLTITGGGPLLYDALAPFVTAGRNSTPGAARSLSLRLRMTGSPAPDPRTPGSPMRVLSRLTLDTGGGLETGALFAKGAGERGEDALTSGYALMRGLGCIREVIAGDYEIQSGEGLVFWRGPAAVRGLWKLRAGQAGAPVPHRSADENRYLRGVALSFTAGRSLQGIVFFSDRVYGAGLDSAGEATGFFRGEYATGSSLSKKDVLRERLIGARAEYDAAGFLNAGCTVYGSWFDRSFHPSDGTRFSGDHATVLGADLNGRYGLLSYGGEYAVMKGGAHALSWTMKFTPGADQMVIVRGRDYQTRFDNPHASGEGDGSDTRNERGVACALRLTHGGGSRLEMYVDAFEHPWPVPDTQLPRRGIEMTVSGEAPLGKGKTASARLSRKVSYEGVGSVDTWGRDVRTGARREEDRWQCGVSCRAGTMFVFSTVFEFAGVFQTGADGLHGALLGEDLTFTPAGEFSLDSRFFLFRTDGFGARLYAYEPGIPGLLSIPPLYDSGLRWYLRIRWSPVAWAEMTMRYASTVKERSVTASGAVTDVPASADSQIGVQVDVRIP
jgi:hypothetical protein